MRVGIGMISSGESSWIHNRSIGVTINYSKLIESIEKYFANNCTLHVC